GKLIQDNAADMFKAEIITFKNDPEELDKYIIGLQDPESPFSKKVGVQNVPSILSMAIRFRAAHDHAVAAEAKEKDEDGKKALGDFKKDIESGIPFS
ncbi:hypothetical protein R7J46_19570, partial [Acinetobacter baumannii]|nr:hypothetical protein [Acinetobacter baumannii]